MEIPNFKCPSCGKILTLPNTARISQDDSDEKILLSANKMFFKCPSCGWDFKPMSWLFKTSDISPIAKDNNPICPSCCQEYVETNFNEGQQVSCKCGEVFHYARSGFYQPLIYGNKNKNSESNTSIFEMNKLDNIDYSYNPYLGKLNSFWNIVQTIINCLIVALMLLTIIIDTSSSGGNVSIITFIGIIVWGIHLLIWNLFVILIRWAWHAICHSSKYSYDILELLKKNEKEKEKDKSIII